MIKRIGKAVCIAAAVPICFIAGCRAMLLVLEPALAEHKVFNEKHLAIMNVFKAWMIFLEMGNRVEDYFKRNGYKTAAIYGMGFLGERLLAQLRDTSIEVRYLIDKQPGSVYGDIPVCSIQDGLEQVDVIVITPVYNFYEIRKELKEETPSKLVSIEDIFKLDN